MFYMGRQGNGNTHLHSKTKLFLLAASFYLDMFMKEAKLVNQIVFQLKVAIKHNSM